MVPRASGGRWPSQAVRVLWQEVWGLLPLEGKPGFVAFPRWGQGAHILTLGAGTPLGWGLAL